MTNKEVADAPCNIRQLVLAQNLMSTCPNSFESKLYRCIVTYGKLLFDLNDDSSIAYLYVFPDSNKSLVFDVDNTMLKIIEGMPNTIGISTEKTFKRLFKEHIRGDIMHDRKKHPKFNNGDYVVLFSDNNLILFNYDNVEVTLNNVG